MTKQEFLYQLNEGLIRLNESEKEQFIHYYDELIEDYVEDGASEEEAVKKLGKPAQVASKILEEAFEEGNIQPKKSINPLLVVLLILGFPLWGSLLLALILLILAGYIVIWCLPFSTGIFAVTGLAASLFSVLFSFFTLQDGISIAVTQLGVGIFVLGLSILSGLLTISMSRYFIKTSNYFSSKIIRLIRVKELLL
ncbi:hypothetical protein BCR24_09730 [Enterococcus ureilyticus]|uniref:DUF1700 domain-containing protein n=1 Tax=Enterococcus ureilyticus TaxID=1131292 RepID=A0A1E5H6B1_9ENTE|nr:DUF1700 domain-containing protein [Enterococcus ureilyticus]MBM7689010.1 putative membrane protein [Enterococcus ureilyticus]MBO0446133.1 DUF1700 domain-containing protein [Enterococcus ureilyticus]OEG20190.1 hypothetical protein BCR24_09730 [Enterococcus ureilyticus]